VKIVGIGNSILAVSKFSKSHFIPCTLLVDADLSFFTTDVHCRLKQFFIDLPFSCWNIINLETHDLIGWTVFIVLLLIIIISVIKKGQYPAIFASQVWSIKDLLYGFQGKFSCITLWVTSPKEARELYLAHSGSQSEHRIWLIFPSHRAIHI